MLLTLFCDFLSLCFSFMIIILHKHIIYIMWVYVWATPGIFLNKFNNSHFHRSSFCRRRSKKMFKMPIWTLMKGLFPLACQKYDKICSFFFLCLFLFLVLLFQSFGKRKKLKQSEENSFLAKDSREVFPSFFPHLCCENYASIWNFHAIIWISLDDERIFIMKIFQTELFKVLMEDSYKNHIQKCINNLEG